MEFESQKFIKFIKAFWLKYEPKVVLGAGLILVAVLSFEFGLIQGKKGQVTPLIVEKPVASQNVAVQADSASTPEAKNPAQETKIVQTSSSIPTKDCAFVGSKNSDKFHISTCRFAKLIKPENLVCFKSAEEALAQNRVGDKGCIK